MSIGWDEDYNDNEPTQEQEAAYEYAHKVSAANVVLGSKDDLEDNIKVELACAIVSFENSHLVASNLVKIDVKIANALCNELLSALQKKDIV